MSLPVETRDLRRAFGSRTALDGVTLSVREREIFGLLGPNGSGKTTLFRILATLLPPGGGTALVGGHDVATAQAAVRQCLGVVFQSPSLDPMLSVEENLRCAGALYGLRGALLKQRCREMAGALRVEDRLDDIVQWLSGGLKRRVEIAKALLPRPRILLLDEPSTGLDPVARAEMWRILVQLRDKLGMTVVLTTHLMDEAERCNRVAVMHEGRVRACDAPDALRAAVGADVLALTAREPVLLAARLREKFGWEAAVVDDTVRVEVPRAHEHVARIVESFPGAVLSVRAGRPTMEDVFVRVTGTAWDAEDKRLEVAAS